MRTRFCRVALIDQLILVHLVLFLLLLLRGALSRACSPTRARSVLVFLLLLLVVVSSQLVFLLLFLLQRVSLRPPLRLSRSCRSAFLAFPTAVALCRSYFVFVFLFNRGLFVG